MSKWHDQDMEIETLKRRIEELEGRGPADIGMVPVLMDRPATGETTQLWREADRIEEMNPQGPADIGMVQPEDFRGLSPYLRHGGVWGVFEVWTAEPLSGDVALWREATL